MALGNDEPGGGLTQQRTDRMEHRQDPTFNGLHPEAKAAAEAAAGAAGLTVEEWISRTILNIARGSAALIGPVGAGNPGAPPAVTLPNQKSVAQAAQAAGIPVEEWLSRAVLESLATSGRLADTVPEPHQANNNFNHHAPVGVAAEPSLQDAAGADVSMLQAATAPPIFEIEPAQRVAPIAAPAAAPTSTQFEAPVAAPAEAPVEAEVRTKDETAAAPGEASGADTASEIGFDPAGLDSLQLAEALNDPLEPKKRTYNFKRLGAIAALAALAALAAAIWVLPEITGSDTTAGGKSDIASALPKHAAGKPKPKQAPAAKRSDKTGGSTAKSAQQPPVPKIDPSLPPPSKDIATLPVPASRHVAWYMKAAELGNTRAQLALAALYLNGRGVKQDYARAAALYRKAAVDGSDPNAQYALGVMLERGEGLKQDEIEALLWYRRAASKGHPLAMYRAGLVHLTSSRVPRDPARAREYFETAAKRGVAAASHQLGLIYESGIGTAKSKSVAFDHYARASAGGHKESTAALARMAPQLSDEDIIRTSELPSPADKHIAWYAKASRLGKTKAQLALAKLYLRGQGVDRDFKKAASLFRDAAVRGRDPDAQYALAVMLERGMGLKRNQGEALRWYRRAAKAGHSRALLNIGFAYVRGVGVKQDYKVARGYFEQAAAKNLAEAQYNLGLIYEHGLGLKKDVPMAFKWYSLAVANQNAPAGKALDRLIPRMSAGEIARAKQLLTQRN